MMESRREGSGEVRCGGDQGGGKRIVKQWATIDLVSLKGPTRLRIVRRSRHEEQVKDSLVAVCSLLFRPIYLRAECMAGNQAVCSRRRN